MQGFIILQPLHFHFTLIILQVYIPAILMQGCNEMQGCRLLKVELTKHKWKLYPDLMQGCGEAAGSCARISWRYTLRIEYTAFYKGALI